VDIALNAFYTQFKFIKYFYYYRNTLQRIFLLSLVFGLTISMGAISNFMSTRREVLG
jgi:hypothetical protein